MILTIAIRGTNNTKVTYKNIDQVTHCCKSKVAVFQSYGTSDETRLFTTSLFNSFYTHMSIKVHKRKKKNKRERDINSSGFFQEILPLYLVEEIIK